MPSKSSWIRTGVLLIALSGVVLYALRKIEGPPIDTRPLSWAPAKFDLPPSIKIFSDVGLGPSQPRAWYADVDYSDKGLKAEPWLSTDPSGREKGSAMASSLGAYVAINGGYFDMVRNPAPTFSLVMRAGKVLVPNIPVVNRGNPPRAYPVTRSAFGIRADRSFDVAWIAAQNGQIWSYPRPVAHTERVVAGAPTQDSPAGGHPWDAVDAVGAGPTLISDGVIQDTYENEVFFGSGFTNGSPYSRAAIGYTAHDHVILFVTDGRQAGGGLTLAQTAREMLRLGCVEAMNLDGGGSETLAVNGVTVNQAPGADRAITTILAFVQSWG